MTPGDQQQQVWEFDARREPRRQRVRFEMIDRDKRLPGGPGQALCRHRADDQPADQTGTRRGGDPIQPVEVDLRFRHRPPHQTLDMDKMRPRRDLGHDAAIGRVLGDLGMDQIGPDRRQRRVADDRDRGFIAARLDAEDR